MAKDTVIIGCRLPHGITLKHPSDPEASDVRIKGLNSAPQTPSGARVVIPYAVTEVDAEFWAIWRASYLDFAPLKSGAIFECKNETEAKAKFRELEGKKTGFEPMDKESHGVKNASKD